MGLYQWSNLKLPQSRTNAAHNNTVVALTWMCSLNSSTLLRGIMARQKMQVRGVAEDWRGAWWAILVQAL